MSRQWGLSSLCFVSLAVWSRSQSWRQGAGLSWIQEEDTLFTEGNEKSWNRRGKAESRSLETQKNYAKKVTSAGALSASGIGFTIPRFLPSVNKHGTSKWSFAHSERDHPIAAIGLLVEGAGAKCDNESVCDLLRYSRKELAQALQNKIHASIIIQQYIGIERNFQAF